MSTDTRRRARTRRLATLLIATLAGCTGGEDADATSAMPAPAATPARPPSASAAGPVARGPNVLLVTLDSVRADHVGCYGATEALTPALDRLCAEGLRFTDAHSVTSWTLPSHAALFTGLYPSAVAVALPSDRLPAKAVTLAEMLGAAGWETHAVVSGPFLDATFQLDQGFTGYDDSLVSSADITKTHGDVTNPGMAERLLSFLDGRDADAPPFFLFAYFWDPHYDYLPPAPYDSMFVPEGAVPVDLHGYETRTVVHAGMPEAELAYVRSQYSGEIRWTDDTLGRVFERLRELGLWESTLVIVTADHGEEFYEHGHKGHKNSLHVETVRVPMLVKPAGEIEGAGSEDTRVASLIDVVPTVLEVAGVAAPGELHGRSLLSPADGSPRFLELVTTTFDTDAAGEVTRSVIHQHRGMIDGRFKLVGNATAQRWQLYDVAADPGETETVGRAHPEQGQRMHAEVEAWYARMVEAGVALGGEAAEMDDATEDRLRSLGYL